MGMQILEIKLVPETWIIAPYATQEQVRRYIEKGWLAEEDEHLDRVFPRNSKGEAFIFRLWLRSPLNQVVSKNNLDRKLLDFRIIDENGFDVNYIKIPGKPLKYRRSIDIGNKKTTEFFEYIDGSFELKFNVATPKPKEFIQALTLAGKIGLLSRTKHGYGKFNIEVVGSTSQP